MEEAIRLHQQAFSADPVLASMLDAGGSTPTVSRGDEHMWTPDAIAKLQHSTRSGKFDTYKEYAKIINDQSKRHMTLRGLFELKPAGARWRWKRSSPPRRSSSALPLAPRPWARSPPKPTTLAVAMNRIRRPLEHR